MKNPVDLTGKRVLMTGASSGIGAAASAQFGNHGSTVIAVARREDDLKKVVDGIRRAGGTAEAIVCDLTDLDAVDQLTQRIRNEFGGVDILINNAGRSIRRPLTESLDRWHDIERTVQLNYYAPARLIRGLGPGMLEQRDGHIINVATWSVIAEGSPAFSAYSASKSALAAMSRVIDTEWSHRGVHQTTLYYPLVRTPMSADTKEYDRLPALTTDEAAQWMIDAAIRRPVRIASRIAKPLSIIDTLAPSTVNTAMKRYVVE